MTKKYLSNDSLSGGGQFDIDELKRVLSQHLGKENAEFFAQAIHTKQGEYLEETSRFSRLIAWIDNEIRNAGIVINAFSPADKHDAYTTANFKLWREHIHLIGEMLYFREMLADNRATTAQRQNIEYAVCKLYGIHYNKDLGGYV